MECTETDRGPGPLVAQVTALSFDETGSSVAVGTRNGFKVYRCGPFAKCFEVSGPRTALVALSTSLSLVAYIETSTTPPTSGVVTPCAKRSHGRTVYLHHLATNTVVEVLRFNCPVLNIHLVAELLVVVLELEVRVYHVRSLPAIQVEVFPTIANPCGLLAHISCSGAAMLAYPSPLVGNGSIAVTEIAPTAASGTTPPFRLRTICAIPFPVQQATVLQFSPDSTLLMVASGGAKGVQIIDILHQRTVNVQWRSLAQSTQVAALAMAQDNTLMCVTAESGAVSVHHVGRARRSEDDGSPTGKPSSTSEFMSQLKDLVHPRAFATLDIPRRTGATEDSMRQVGSLLRWANPEALQLVTTDGRLYHIEVAAGECRIREAYSLSEDHVWLLGRRYDLWVLTADAHGAAFDDQAALATRLQSLLRFTYRSDFAPIAKHRITDAAWGCMLRTGQMMLAQAFRLHYGLDTLSDCTNSIPGEGGGCEERIASWFCDTPDSPFSIHHIAQAGERRGKPVGNWFSPTLIATVLQELVASNAHLHGNPLLVYVADTATLYFNQIERLQKAEEFQPILLLIPVMLGASSHANPVYFDALLRFFHLPEFLGVVGGRPNASYYFVGYQMDVSCQLLYLDPHVTVHPALTAITPQSRDTLRQSHRLTMPFTSLDPSVVLGFYCRDRAALEMLVETTQEIQANGPPIFTWRPSDEQHQLGLGAFRSYSDLEWRAVECVTDVSEDTRASPSPHDKLSDEEAVDSDEEWEQVA